MRKGMIIFISIAIMLLASISLFAQYGRGYGELVIAVMKEAII